MPRLAEHLRGRASAIILGLVIVAATVWLRLPTWNDHILFIDEPKYYAFAARLDLPGARLFSGSAMRNARIAATATISSRTMRSAAFAA